MIGYGLKEWCIRAISFVLDMLLNVFMYAHLAKYLKVCIVLNLKSYILVILCPLFALVYDLLLETYGRVRDLLKSW